MYLCLEQSLKTIKKNRGYLSPSVILCEIQKDLYVCNRDFTFVIMGRSGPTGKSWLWNELKTRGFRVIELSEQVYNIIEYSDLDNHVIVNAMDRAIVIILNRPIVY